MRWPISQDSEQSICRPTKFSTELKQVASKPSTLSLEPTDDPCEPNTRLLDIMQR